MPSLHSGAASGTTSTSKSPPSFPTEHAFTRYVINLAERLGWKVSWIRDARKTYSRGVPDLMMVRERVLFAELKWNRGSLGSDQKLWRDALQAAGQEWYLWRPQSIVTMTAVLETWVGRR